MSPAFIGSGEPLWCLGAYITRRVGTLLGLFCASVKLLRVYLVINPPPKKHMVLPESYCFWGAGNYCIGAFLNEI